MSGCRVYLNCSPRSEVNPQSNFRGAPQCGAAGPCQGASGCAELAMLRIDGGLGGARVTGAGGRRRHRLDVFPVSRMDPFLPLGISDWLVA